MLMMVISSVTISFGGLIMRNMESADPWQLNFYRAVGLLGAVSGILAFRYRRSIVQVIRDIGWIGIAGGILLGCAGMTHMQALANTSIANAMFVLGAIPFFSALFARIFLAEKLKPITLWTMVLAAIGLGVMVSEGFRLGEIYGNVMAVLTALTFSIYAVIVRKKRRQEMLPTLLVSSTFIIIYAFFETGDNLAISLHDMIWCFIWGGALSGIANYLFIVASKHLAAAETTLFMLLEFALAPLWVWWIINETPGYWTIAGGTLIIAAVALRALFELFTQRGKRARIPSLLHINKN